ncbi:MAG TPA: zf-HC2 domain-containing protein [Longimicrobiales bacterium]|nr:zf-HC2 domain-containing protein [Longimicrobiales bacterium]
MDKWTDRLSEYLDDELTQPEREALEAHLLECADCGATLHELRAVVVRAGQVLDAPPSTDLWAGIEQRIKSADRPIAKSPHRLIAFSVPQLLAASIVLMMLSAGSVYLMLARNDSPQIAAGVVMPGATTQAQSVKPVMNTVHYNTAIAELEAALDAQRSKLDTATVRIIETNMRAIDMAIVEARTALGRDPSNTYLNHYLDETMQRKIQLLRRAAGIRAQT